MERFEGCRLAAYQDVGSVWTIGYGRTRGVHSGMTCTQAQAEAWLQQDVREAESAVNRGLTQTRRLTGLCAAKRGSPNPVIIPGGVIPLPRTARNTRPD
jgi:GH24 family phage-related lysozyme (muramidase)